ncbi:MAG: endopeptidase La [Gammaproteobacteria bacterium]|nr:endopeptidase La [Gammaproteobacteria bacterium]
MAKSESKNKEITNLDLAWYPVVALRDVVVFPFMIIPLFVGRTASIGAIEAAQAENRRLFLVTQKEAAVEAPEQKDLYTHGVLASILQLLRLPDGTIKVLIEGEQRAKLKKLHKKNDSYFAEVDELVSDFSRDAPEIEVLIRTAKSEFEDYVKLNKRIPVEILSPIDSIFEVEKLIDVIASHLPITVEKKQVLLEITDVCLRLEKLIQLIQEEVDLVNIEKRLKGRVKRQMEKSQREYYLNEQIKAIQSELGEISDSPNEQENLEKKVRAAGMPQEALEKCLSELHKLKMMPPMSAEATVSRNYLDVMLSVPWKKKSKLKTNLAKAQALLDQEHYGLERVKERIVEYLAVQERVKKLKGPILCLVGPPGVGKTSLGRSIANATGRELIRMSLGGVRDEAEIRGHRRTYIGALPGKIIQKISKTGVKNPFFLLDEIDKMAMDFRGDPASALLEVLDPEQNATFNDHYLEVDYDLSEVMFVATANSLNIPPALKDRMEIIRISGYTEDEKLNIAMQHLYSKQVEQNGLRDAEITIELEAMRDIIRYYTQEAGVRSLEREISKLCRKVVKELLLTPLKKRKKVIITPDCLEKYLGVKRHRYGSADEFDQMGQVTGLAWTEVGGVLLRIEAAIMLGKGKTQYTGSLGKVMQESINAAMTVVKSRLMLFDLKPDYFDKHDVHIHVPEGATPKDGPSAGIGMCTALISVVAGLPVRADVAMTGEITLRGEVLPIGGLKEKLLAAHRGNIRTVIIPEGNRQDLQDIPENIKKELSIHPVKWIDEVLSIALVNYEQRVGTVSSVVKRKKKLPTAAASTSLLKKPKQKRVRAH